MNYQTFSSLKCEEKLAVLNRMVKGEIKVEKNSPIEEIMDVISGYKV